MEPFVQVEDDIRLAIEIAAERQSLTGPEFAAKLQLLIETCRRQGHRAAEARVTVQIAPVRDLQFPGEPPPRPTDSIGPVKVPEINLGGKTLAKDGIEATPPVHVIPRITPMRTIEDARAAHRAAHPELYNEDGTRKSTAPGYDINKVGRQELNGEITEEDLDELERATRPDPPLKTAQDNGYKFKGPTGKARKVDDAGRADIQRRAKQARTDNTGRYPKGFIRRLSEEYGVSDALIYNIIYSDPAYEAVPKP